MPKSSNELKIFMEHVDKQFDRIWEVVKDNPKRFDGIDRRFDHVEERLDDLETHMFAVRSTVKAHTKEIAGLKRRDCP